MKRAVLCDLSCDTAEAARSSRPGDLDVYTATRAGAPCAGGRPRTVGRKRLSSVGGYGWRDQQDRGHTPVSIQHASLLRPRTYAAPGRSAARSTTKRHALAPRLRVTSRLHTGTHAAPHADSGTPLDWSLPLSCSRMQVSAPLARAWHPSDADFRPTPLTSRAAAIALFAAALTVDRGVARI